MIAGGAIANIIDRVHYGYVIDFIDFYRIWPNIFNVADSCIYRRRRAADHLIVCDTQSAPMKPVSEPTSSSLV